MSVRAARLRRMELVVVAAVAAGHCCMPAVAADCIPFDIRCAVVVDSLVRSQRELELSSSDLQHIEIGAALSVPSLTYECQGITSSIDIAK
jgi:hypothetical protein